MRTRLLPLLALVIALGTPVVANAALTEVSPIGTATPTCPGVAPADCRIIVARTTGFQAKVGTTTGFSTVKVAGSLVAWSVSLASVTDARVKSLSSTTTGFGGAPRVGIVVLAPLGKSQFKVIGKGPLVDVTRYLGTTPQFALPTSIPVKPGYVIGVSVPTWAPMLQLGVGSDTSWRSTRTLKMTVAKNFSTQTALVGTETSGDFAALYQSARLLYSGTVVQTPKLNPVAKTTPTTPKKTTK